MTEFPETRSSLLAQVRSPDNREAWEQFVLIYRPVIYRMARRRGMQDADAQDIVQTVLMRVAGAVNRWEKTEPGTRFRHWLRRVAKNAIFTALSRSPNDAASGGSNVHDLLTKQPEIAPDVEQELGHVGTSLPSRPLQKASTAIRGRVSSAWRRPGLAWVPERVLRSVRSALRYGFASERSAARER